MTPDTIRRIDTMAGKPLCFILTLFRYFRNVLVKERTGRPIRKILFVKLIEQGATVLAYGAILRSIEAFGRDNVYFIVFQENREILDIMDVIPRENVFTVRQSSFPVFLFDIATALMAIRRLKIDTVIDMEFFARASAILAYLTGASRRVGHHRFTAEAPYRGDLMTHRIHYNPYLHTARTYISLVDALRHNPADIPMVKAESSDERLPLPRFIPDDSEKERVLATINHAGGKAITGPIILLNPNASDIVPIRKWPADNFVSLGRKILDRHAEATLIITGAPSEISHARRICDRLSSDRVVNLAGLTSLWELCVLYTLADIMITNDSGPAHFASMTDIHTVVLFGPETPALFGPLGSGAHILYKHLACSPCVNVFNHRFSPCTNNRCMTGITVDEVYETVEFIISGTGK
ncbi:MAG: glycosyltransferase family 9 protein [Deltaproteobacteria bacterium]|nr:glycosyltransferase family 9 protein [Deltaproteobacteria bacterium]